MSEPKWLATSNARAMVRHLLRLRLIPWLERPRKWHLLLAACAYGLWDRLPGPSRAAVAVAEAFADGAADEDRLGQAEYVAEGVKLGIEFVGLRREGRGSDPGFGLDPTVWADYARRCDEWGLRPGTCAPYRLGPAPALEAWPVQYAAHLAHLLTYVPWWDLDDQVRGLPYAADLVRDVFGNPFRPARFAPRWRTADVMGLARGIYDERAFDRLPLLADALLDAGCADEAILAHCRSEGPHVRGCWVVDLVLGMA